MSPLAKGIRTFAAGMVGVLGTVVILVNSGDYRAGAILLGLGVATAAVAGLAAGLLAASGNVASTPLGKALATFLQMIGSGLAVVAFNSVADLTTFPKLALTLGVSSLVAALQTLAQTSAEEG